MSLINDALRRTRQVQQRAHSSVAQGLQLHPLEAAPRQARGPGLLRLGLLGAAGLCALLMISQGVRGHGPAPTAATAPAARGSSPGQPASPAPTAHDAAGLGPVSASQPAIPAAESPPSPLGAAESATNGRSASAAIVSKSSSPASARAEAAPETSPPGPRPIRLQAIIFHPTRPSAIINGKTLFLGDMLGEMQLVAIGRESATLAGSGQTNLLTLH
jgi:hypothetical protein